MFRPLLAGLLLGALPAAAQLADDPFAGRSTLERADLVAAVLERNPTLVALREAHRAALERPAQARSLADPMLRYSVAPLSIASDDVPFGHRLEVEQELPYPGKRRLRGEGATAEADREAAEIEVARLDLALAASLAYDDLVLATRALALVEEHQRLLDDAFATAKARYGAGFLSQQEPLAVEVELAHLAHERLGDARRRDEALVRLAALLHLPTGATLPPPADSEVRAPETLAEPAELVATARAERPELRAVDAEIRALETAAQLARLDRRPDLGVMASYDSMWMDGAHRWMAGVSLALPIRKEKLAAAEVEADARLASARARRDALLDQIDAEVTTARLRLHEARHVLDLYDAHLLPASRDQVTAARSGVETGRTDFAALLDAERNLRRVELGFHEARADFERLRAELARALGRLPGERP